MDADVESEIKKVITFFGCMNSSVKLLATEFDVHEYF